jgi:hypothetical protein
VTWRRRAASSSADEALAPKRWTAHRPRTHGVLWIDDERLLSWGADWRLRLWDAATAVELAAFHDPERTRSGDGGIRGVVRLRDGYLVSWGHDGVMNLWDLAQPTPLARVETGTDAITGVVVIDDRRFVSWSGSGVVELWTADDLTSHQRLRWHADYEGARSRTPPFVVDEARGLVAWRSSWLSSVPFAAEQTPMTLEPFRSEPVVETDDDDDDEDPADIATVIRLPSGNVVAFSHGGRVCELTAADLTLVREYQALPTAARGATAITEGRFAAWYAGRLAVYRVGTAEPVFFLDSADDIVVAAVAVPAGGLAYRTLRRELVGWDGEERWRAPMPTGRETVALRAIGDSDVVAWSFPDGGVAVGGPGRSGVLATDGSGIDAVAAHPSWPQTTLLAAAMADGDLCVGDAMPVADDVSPSTMQGAIRRVVTDGTLVVASSEAGPVTLHDPHDGRLLRTLAGTDGGGCGVIDGLLLLGDRVVGTEVAGSIYAWAIDDGALLGVLDEGTFGPKGKTLALSGRAAVSWTMLQDESGFLLWDLVTTMPIATLEHPGPAQGAALVGERLVTWADAPDLRVWTLDGNLVESVRCHELPIAGAVAVGGRVVSWTDDGAPVVWTPGRDPVLLRFDGGDAAIASAHASGDEVLFRGERGALIAWSAGKGAQHVLAHRADTSLVFAERGPSGWLLVDRDGVLVTVSPRGAIRRFPLGGPDPVVVASPRHAWVAAGAGRDVSIVELATGRVTVRPMPTRVRAIAVVNETCIALGLGDGSVSIVVHEP